MLEAMNAAKTMVILSLFLCVLECIVLKRRETSGGR